MFKNQKDYPLSKMEKRILEEWETAWKGAQGEGDDKNTQTDANKMLYDLVRENYKIFARKAARNRDDNYAQKNWLLYGIGIAVFVESILLLLLTIYWEKMEWSSSGLIMYVVYFSAFQAILFCAAEKKDRRRQKAGDMGASYRCTGKVARCYGSVYAGSFAL